MCIILFTHTLAHTPCAHIYRSYTHAHTLRNFNLWWSEGSHGTTGKHSTLSHTFATEQGAALVLAQFLRQNVRSVWRLVKMQVGDWWQGDNPVTAAHPSSRCRVRCSKMALHSLHRTPPLKKEISFYIKTSRVHKGFSVYESWMKVHDRYGPMLAMTLRIAAKTFPTKHRFHEGYNGSESMEQTNVHQGSEQHTTVFGLNKMYFI